MDIRERRQELQDALNSHDLERVKLFYDPSYEMHCNKRRLYMHDRLVSRMLPKMLEPSRQYHETAEIQNVQVTGDTATLQVGLSVSSRTCGLTLRGRRVTTETWKEVDGEWRLTGEDWSLIKQPDRIGNVLWWTASGCILASILAPRVWHRPGVDDVLMLVAVTFIFAAAIRSISWSQKHSAWPRP